MEECFQVYGWLSVGACRTAGLGNLLGWLDEWVQVGQLVQQLNFAGLSEVGLLDLIPE